MNINRVKIIDNDMMLRSTLRNVGPNQNSPSQCNAYFAGINCREYDAQVKDKEFFDKKIKTIQNDRLKFVLPILIPFLFTLAGAIGFKLLIKHVEKTLNWRDYSKGLAWGSIVSLIAIVAKRCLRKPTEEGKEFIAPKRYEFPRLARKFDTLLGYHGKEGAKLLAELVDRKLARVDSKLVMLDRFMTNQIDLRGFVTNVTVIQRQILNTDLGDIAEFFPSLADIEDAKQHILKVKEALVLQKKAYRV